MELEGTVVEVVTAGLLLVVGSILLDVAVDLLVATPASGSVW